MRPLRYEGPIQRERLHYLDWLRVLAVLGVFYAHTADIFDKFYWHIKGGEQNTGLLVLVVFGTEWGMALFFFLAGASAWFALASRTAGQFVSERFTRLIIPCLVGFILLSPPIAYLIAISHSLYHGNFLQFYPYYFENIHVSWNPQWLGIYAYHLWFLVFLFFISTLALPVLLYLKRERSLRFIAKLAAFCDRPGGLFVFVLPIALIQLALRAPFPGYQSWSDFFTWLLIFIYGFMFLAEPRFESAIEKQWKLALFVGIASLLIMLVASYTGVLSSWDSLSSYSGGYVLYQLLSSIVTWSWMLFVLYFGMRFLNFSDKFIEYANEAVLLFSFFPYPLLVSFTFFTLHGISIMALNFLFSTTFLRFAR